jgi:hypothetical protein
MKVHTRRQSEYDVECSDHGKSDEGFFHFIASHFRAVLRRELWRRRRGTGQILRVEEIGSTAFSGAVGMRRHGARRWGADDLAAVPRVCSRGTLPREPGVHVSKRLFGFCGPTSARRGSPCSRLSDVHTRFAQEPAPTGRIPEAIAEQLIANKSLMYGKARRCSLRRGRSDSRSPAVSRKCQQASDEAVETGRGRRSHLSSTPPGKFVPNSSLCGCDSIFTL